MSFADKNCVFCAIINRQLPASVVYEDSDVLAFMDIHPINKGHVLVVPKAHFAQLREMPSDLAHKLFNAVLSVEKALWATEGLRCEGTNILQNNGRSAWQDVFHAHFHVIPRFEGDGFRIKYQSEKTERPALDALAQAIKQRLAAPAMDNPSLVLPFFGAVDFAHLKETYESSALIKGNSVSLAISVTTAPGQSIALEKWQAVAFILEHLPALDEKYTAHLRASYFNGSETAEYIAHHLEVVDRAALEAIIDFNDEKQTPNEQMLRLIRLKSVHFFLENAAEFNCLVDYVLQDSEFTNYVLCFRVQANGEWNQFSMES